MAIFVYVRTHTQIFDISKKSHSMLLYLYICSLEWCVTLLSFQYNANTALLQSVSKEQQSNMIGRCCHCSSSSLHSDALIGSRLQRRASDRLELICWKAKYCVIPCCCCCWRNSVRRLTAIAKQIWMLKVSHNSSLQKIPDPITKPVPLCFLKENVQLQNKSGRIYGLSLYEEDEDDMNRI